MPPRALGVLAALLAQPGRVVSKRALLDASWPDTFVTEASLLEVIRVLREALGDDRLNPSYIQTVHRRGYRFVAEVSFPLSPPVSPKLADQSLASEGGPVSPKLADQCLASEGGPVSPKLAEQSLASEGGPVSPKLADQSLASEGGWRPLIVTAGAAVTATIAMAFVFAIFGQRASEPRPTMRFTIALPAATAIDPLRGAVAVSADGTQMVYVASSEGRSRLFLRTIDRDTPHPIDGTDAASDPFFSPDGEWIGFFAHGSLKKIRVEGGTAVVICAARAGAGASWGQDGTIVFGGGPGGGLARVSSEMNSEPVVLIAPTTGSRELSYGWPDLLPDGRAVIFTALSLADQRIDVLDFGAGRRHTIIEHAAFGRYSPTGHLVFERRGRLEAAPFALGERRLTEASRPILRGLATASAALAGPRFAFSRTGSLIYVPSTSSDIDERLHWMDVQGRLEPVPLPPVPIGGIDVSPNLQRLALTVEGDNGHDLWVGDLERGALSRLTADGQSASPTWRPDGLEIAFAYSKAGPFNLFVRPTDADSSPRPLLQSQWNQFPTSWSADGQLIAFTEFNPVTGADIWIFDIQSGERRPAVRTLFDESHARFSPDGRWLAYMSNESGRWDVFVRPADGAAARVQVSTQGGAWPCWSIDGRTLYFSLGGQAAAAAVQTTPSLRVSAPMTIPGGDDLQVAGGHADLHRVLVRQGGGAPVRRELRVVLEWFSELTRLVRLPA